MAILSTFKIPQKRLSEKVFRRGVNYSLDRLRRCLAQLGNPEKHLRNVIHIAGTNGKGSTLTFLASALVEAGFTVGTYTSPHILDYPERICINFSPISQDDFATYFEQIEALGEDRKSTRLNSSN